MRRPEHRTRPLVTPLFAAIATVAPVPPHCQDRRQGERTLRPRPGHGPAGGCGLNCSGTCRLQSGKLARLTAAAPPCGAAQQWCTSFETDPRLTADGLVAFDSFITTWEFSCALVAAADLAPGQHGSFSTSITTARYMGSDKVVFDQNGDLYTFPLTARAKAATASAAGCSMASAHRLTHDGKSTEAVWTTKALSGARDLAGDAGGDEPRRGVEGRRAVSKGKKRRHR